MTRRDVFERFAVVGKTASLLEVEGRIESAEIAQHLVPEVLRDLGRDDDHPGSVRALRRARRRRRVSRSPRHLLVGAT